MHRLPCARDHVVRTEQPGRTDSETARGGRCGNVRTRVHTYIHAYAPMHIRACVHIYVCIYIYTYTHTYPHLHVCV